MNLFISEDELQQFKGLSAAVQPRHILPFIREAQELHIKPLLGSALYDELLSQTIEDELSEPNQLLLPKVQQALIYLAYAAYVLRGQFISTSAGLRIKESDASAPPTQSDAAMLYRMARQDADRFVRQLIDYLQNNREQYPQWRPCNPEAGGWGMF